MSSKSWVKVSLSAVLTASLTACAQSPGITTPASSQPQATQTAQTIQAPEASVSTSTQKKNELTSQVLYQFLLGEIASQRGELKLSAEAYADLAARTQDARVAKRATELALHARLSSLALKNARLWYSLESGSAKATQTLASLLVSSGHLSEAKPILQAWLKSAGDGKAADGKAFMQLHGLMAKQKDKQAAYDFMAEVLRDFPSVPEAHFALAQSAWGAGNALKALAELDEVMRLKPGWEAAPLFKAQILQQEGGDADALAFFQKYLADWPDEREIRLAYAKLLARTSSFADSRKQFEWLAKEMPDNPENHLAIGLIAMQTEDLDSAEASISKALQLGHPDEGGVRYHLGQLAEIRERLEDALTWYQSVQKGRVFDAKLRTAILLNKLGRTEQAQDVLTGLQPNDDAARVQLVLTEALIMRESKDYAAVVAVLTKALEKLPDNPDLLYDRAMAAEKLNRLDMVEADLRKLIKIKPDYAHAYNALGYTLADRTVRIAEALDLLETAIKLDPDDPFIQDSMGWALFKAKRYEEALDYLWRAHKAKADPEIAAHLGETLWAAGKKAEARQIWEAALKKHPENESLRETTSRLLP